MRPGGLRGLCLGLAALSSLSGCLFRGEKVTRVYSGREVDGPYVTPEAYAHYAQGVLDESQGQLAKAMREFQQALLDDDSSPALWTRLASLECRTGKDPGASFARAEALDREFAPLARERARCALARGDAAGALALAERAVALDPDDDAASLLVAQCHQKLGRPADARRWLLALLLRDPTSAEASQAYRALEPRGRARVEPAADPLGARRPGQTRSKTEDVDRALAAGDGEHAKRLALAAGVGPGQLALRAAALGVSSVARTEAERVLAADPNDGDALVAALCAASLDGSAEQFEAALRRVGQQPFAPSPLGVRLLGELLGHRVGTAARDAWLEAWSLPAPSDPLEARVDARRAPAQ